MTNVCVDGKAETRGNAVLEVHGDLVLPVEVDRVEHEIVDW